MGVVAAISAGATLASGYLAGESAKTEAIYINSILNANARMDDIYAEKTIKRGEKEAKQYSDKVNQTVGAQRVAFASQGIDVNSGTAADIQTETLDFGAEDVMTIQNNAYLEAMGLRTRATNSRFQAKAETLGAENIARNSLISGGLKALDKVNFSSSGGGSSNKSSSTSSAGGSYGSYDNIA